LNKGANFNRTRAKALSAAGRKMEGVHDPWWWKGDKLQYASNKEWGASPEDKDLQRRKLMGMRHRYP
jgi:hypothetical protein